MSHRPFPNADRARHQLDRHDNETAPLPDGSGSSGPAAFARLVISDEAREAMSARLASAGASLRAAFERLVGSEETTT